MFSLLAICDRQFGNVLPKAAEVPIWIGGGTVRKVE